jgi:hypothetical protein
VKYLRVPQTKPNLLYSIIQDTWETNTKFSHEAEPAHTRKIANQECLKEARDSYHSCQLLQLIKVFKLELSLQSVDSTARVLKGLSDTRTNRKTEKLGPQ